MGWLDRLDVSLLCLMLMNTVVIVGSRIARNTRTMSQNRGFVREAAPPFRAGNLQSVIALSRRNARSHVATVVGAALTAFGSTPADLTDADAICSAERAAQRSRRTMSADLRLGLRSLATTAGCAPFIGLLGTIFGILNAFGPMAMSKSAAFAMIASNLATALVTAAFGLFVAISAAWSHDYFRRQAEKFEREMSNALLELTTYLHLHPEYRCLFESSPTEATGSLFVESSVVPIRAWEVPYDRQRLLMLWVSISALYLAFFLARGMYWSYRWRHSYVESTFSWQQAGGQDAVSPDGRFRAVVPVFYRSWEPNGENGKPYWSCGPNPRVTLRIIPNDRPLAWKTHICGAQTSYVLESDGALTTRNCSVPSVIWRTNDELLLQCSECSRNDLQQMRLAFFPHEITILSRNGNRIYPPLVKPPPQCPD